MAIKALYGCCCAARLKKDDCEEQGMEEELPQEG
jgi:hypothetical protein